MSHEQPIVIPSDDEMSQSDQPLDQADQTLPPTDCWACPFHRATDDEVAHFKTCTAFYRNVFRSNLADYNNIFPKAQAKFSNLADLGCATHDGLRNAMDNLWGGFLLEHEVRGADDPLELLESIEDDKLVSYGCGTLLYNHLFLWLSETRSRTAGLCAIEDAARAVFQWDPFGIDRPWGKAPGHGDSRGEAWREEEVEWLRANMNKYALPQDVTAAYLRHFGLQNGRDPASVALKMRMIRGEVELHQRMPAAWSENQLHALNDVCYGPEGAVDDAALIGMFQAKAMSRGLRVRSGRDIVAKVQEMRRRGY